MNKFLNKRIFIIFILPLSLGLLSVLSFQPFNLIFINFIIFPSLFLLINYVKKKSKNIYRKKPYLKNLFFVGHSFGFGFFISGTYWISQSLTFDQSFNFLIPFSVILLPLSLGIFYGLASLISGLFIRENISSILFFCVSFSSIDYLRSKIFTGFPWNLWAYSFSSYTELLQLLNLVGLFAFNLISLTIFCIPIIFFLKRNLINFLTFIVSIFAIFSCYIYGSFVINSNLEIKNKSTANIKIISPNFDLKYNLSENEIEDLLLKLSKYSEPNKEKKTLFVWPEGVFTGFDVETISKNKKIIKDKFSKNHTIIFGINTLNQETGLYNNSLVAINHDFEIIYQYDKKKLVPFGEFLPFEKYLHRAGLKKITQGHGSFSVGKAEQKNFEFDSLNILPLICYEIIFPELVQNAKPNTNLIINISEDAWFGGSIGPHQHFTKAIFRAIESNSYVVRSANQGISAFIDNRGKIIKSLKPNETGNIELNISFINSKFKNKNDLIFFILLFTYTIIFFTLRNKLNDKK